MLLKRFTVLTIAVFIALSSFAGCTQQANNVSSATASSTSNTSSNVQSAGSAVSDGNGGDSGEIIDIEIWHVNNGFPAVEKGSETYEFYKELFGVGVIQPYVEWNSGETYQQQLNLRIAANDLPDLFMPVNGNASACFGCFMGKGEN